MTAAAGSQRVQLAVQFATLEVRLHKRKLREAYWVKLSSRKAKDKTKTKGNFPVLTENWYGGAAV